MNAPIQNCINGISDSWKSSLKKEKCEIQFELCDFMFLFASR